MKCSVATPKSIWREIVDDLSGRYSIVFGVIMKDVKHLHRLHLKKSCMSCGHVDAQQIQYVLIMAS